MGEDIVIFYNDSIDSDNVAAAMALAWDVAKKRPRTRLNLAIKPPYGPKGDAELHGRLAAWDLATCLHQWTGKPVEVLTDLETLSEIDNPVNLNFHHHEELSSRSEGELVSYEAIMEVEPLKQRVEGVRDWYRGCIKQAEENPENQGISVRALNLNSLCDTIRRAASVEFFGGSSLRILREFIQRGVAHKVQCSLQVGSCDLSANLFPNQFNVGLNQRAAKFVLDRFREFKSFTVVPSHSAQDIKYSLLGLKQAGGRCLEKRILGFNCHEDPVKIATGQVTLDDDYPSKACPMPDLTAFLCALIPGYMGSKRGFVQVNDRDGVLLFKPASEGIPMHDLVNGRSLEESDVGEVLASLEGGGGGGGGGGG
ncbi:hypothetical protein ACJ41O_008638 [Fusarium nematophilum]